MLPGWCCIAIADVRFQVPFLGPESQLKSGFGNIQSRSLSGRHVSTGFLAPVLGAMMKQVCWHSRRSKAYRGLPEARMAGATVEETAFEDVNMWQAPVSQKPPLMGT